MVPWAHITKVCLEDEANNLRVRKIRAVCRAGVRIGCCALRMKAVHYQCGAATPFLPVCFSGWPQTLCSEVQP